MNLTRPSRPFKLLLIGDSAVGKTSLMLRFADNTFIENFIPTIGIDFKVKTFNIREKQIKLQLWDTAGQEKFYNITRSYYRNADAIVLVYDRTAASSFQNVSRWMRNIDENAPDDVLRVLVGNKSDLHHSIIISTQDGKNLAGKYNIDYFETSAKSDTNANVSKMFYALTEKLLERNQVLPITPIDNIDILNQSSGSSYERFVSCCSAATTMHK
ncbi:unnamed protein product [Rotaria magnacalcarata]|uniref:Uncharacterized protein n=1 Tax=Rotaria magnacalcarata TaxID=392030 RepID=A0A816Q196_9BILA|nr:unnamed protein product [Rotaria magnacalcarata]CAF2055042.1 unnamed protein product [Rotaria magnacalcarata]CAF3831478.1 unnamed protein product [Rotaria magnacalcarata]